MKLNNRGWGLSMMIGFISVFAVMIVVISVLAYNLGVVNDVPSLLNKNSAVGYFIHL